VEFVIGNVYLVIVELGSMPRTLWGFNYKLQIHNHKLLRLAAPCYEIDPPVDNPLYLP
jgi:hypothetical protein